MIVSVCYEKHIFKLIDFFKFETVRFKDAFSSQFSKKMRFNFHCFVS